MDCIFPINGRINELRQEEVKSHNELELISPTCMIFGNSGSCKTYLLMQAAITVAGDNNKVLFVSPQKLTRLPSSVHGMKHPTSLTMKHIQFMYAKNHSELQAYLASLHLRSIDERPSTIIVDELNHYCSNVEVSDPLSQLVLFAKLSSLIQEAVFFTTNKPSFDQNGKDEKKTVRLAMMSWTLDSKESSLKVSDLEDVANRIENCECWKIRSKSKKDSSLRPFELSRKTTLNETLLLNYSLRKVNPSLDVIYLEDIFLEKNEDQTSSS